MQPGFEDAHRRLEDYTQRVAEVQRRAEEVQEQLRSARARAASDDGSVSVVLAPGGRLESLELTPRAMQLDHQRLAAVITQTIRSAHADAAAQTQEAIRPLVGESDAMDFLREQTSAALADDPAVEADAANEQAPEQSAQDDDEHDDDDYFRDGPLGSN